MQLNKKKIHSALFGSSNKRIGDVEVCFIPFWVLLVSNLRSGGRANPERTQSEGRANPERQRSSVVVIPKRTKIRVPLCEKKVAERCKKREQRKFTFFAELMRRHEVKWRTITITIGMRPLSPPISHSISQIAGQTQ